MLVERIGANFVNTFKPQYRDEVVRRRVEKGTLVPKGMRLLGEWGCIGSGRVFRLLDIEDPATMLEATYPWTDIGDLEVYPVMETEKMLSGLAERMTATAAR